LLLVVIGCFRLSQPTLHRTIAANGAHIASPAHDTSTPKYGLILFTAANLTSIDERGALIAVYVSKCGYTVK
jgi:hypothetical protein